MKAEVNKLDINKLVNVLTVLNNLNTKINNLAVDKLKNVLVNLKEKLCSEYRSCKSDSV